MITVQFLGGASLRSGDTPLGGPPAQRHRIGLLAMIAAAWPQPLSRDRAMALLWPERDLANSRRLLNLAVHVLRAALGEGAITSTGDGLLLNPSLVVCDLVDMRAALAASDLERVVKLYGGPLLDGFHLDESNDFAYWLDERRSELSHSYVGALLALAETQEKSGLVHECVGTCRRLVATDPHSGVYAQKLMRALDAAGDRMGVKQHAAEHAQRLRTDLEVGPDPEVAALAERLGQAAPKRQPSASREESAEASVAVLPFLNLGSGAEDEYFADGVTEDVIAQLSKIRALKVISRSSVMPFKQRQSSIREIGRALGVATVLDGSIRRSGDRVRIVAKLVDARTDRHLWVETYDRQLTDIFAIQSYVALSIAAALKAELTRDERTRVQTEPTTDIRAYQFFLRGRQLLTEYTADSMARAIASFEQAIGRDPDFAFAHALLATAFIESVEHGTLQPVLAYGRAAKAVRSALRLDPTLGAAHCAMAQLEMMRDFDWTGAERDFKRALELSPSYSDAYDLYGRLCAALERYDEALELLRRARKLDPLAHRNDFSSTLLRAGRYNEALRFAKDASEMDVSHARTLATLGWAYFLSGQQGAGVAELERAVAASPGSTLWLSQLGQAYALSGKESYARALLLELEARGKHSYVSPYHLAYVYTGLGEADRAIDLLEVAVAERSGPTYGIRTSFLFRSLHPHPRFAALMKQLNMS